MSPLWSTRAVFSLSSAVSVSWVLARNHRPGTTGPIDVHHPPDGGGGAVWVSGARFQVGRRFFSYPRAAKKSRHLDIKDTNLKLIPNADVAL